MLKLVGTEGVEVHILELTPGSHEIGREKNLRYRIDHHTVSRKHALIELDDKSGEIWVTDLRSKNGTLVNDVRISERTHINVGDTIAIGQIELTLVDDLTTGAGRSSSAAALSSAEPDKSVVIPVSEALRPLPSKVAQLPDLFTTLSEAARLPVWSESREVLLKRWLKLVRKVIPAERLAVLMTDESTDEVYVAATLLMTKHDPGQFTLSRTIVNEIMTRHHAVLISDACRDSQFASQQSILMSPLRSAMAVPLFDEDRVLGILYADTSNELHRYNDDYLRLLATFGNIIASRLLNYALAQERHERQLYEAELRRASAIQQNLLSRTKPEFPGYLIDAFHQPCRAVGGDLYDMAVLPDGNLLLCVADVSGKGLGAALLMSNILACLRTLYNVTPLSLSDLVATVSSQLWRCSAAADYATLFVGEIDPASHQLTYVNAGHNPPIILRSSGAHEYLPATGVVVGAFDRMTWERGSTILDKGDSLVIYTDGVTEATRGEEQYSEERLERLVLNQRDLNPEKLLAAVVHDVEEFLSEAAHSDDITMLAVKRIE